VRFRLAGERRSGGNAAEENLTLVLMHKSSKESLANCTHGGSTATTHAVQF